jgi:hypothetical protein
MRRAPNLIDALKRVRFPDRRPSEVTLADLQRFATEERQRQQRINERIARGEHVPDPILEAEGYDARA